MTALRPPSETWRNGKNILHNQSMIYPLINTLPYNNYLFDHVSKCLDNHWPFYGGELGNNRFVMWTPGRWRYVDMPESGIRHGYSDLACIV